LHGTSGRYGYVVDDTEQSFVGKVATNVLSYFGYNRLRYINLNGTRNVITERSNGNSFYGTDQFRLDKVKDISLRKGEVIYFELVGDVAPGTPIMPDCQVDKKELPDIYAEYGPTMRYKYGCPVGECKLYVYRILQFNEDNQAVELSWPQVKKRCGQLGIQFVPELHDKAIVVHGRIPKLEEDPDWNNYTYTWTLENLKAFVEPLSKGASLLDPSHIREGVAVRVETPDGRCYTLKEKSFEFKFLEGIVKSVDSYVDMEESS